MNAEKLATCGRYATIEEIQGKTKKSPETIRFFIQAYNTCNHPAIARRDPGW